MIVAEHPEWPGTEPREDPRDFVDKGWDPTIKKVVIRHVEEHGKVLYSWLGSSTCRFCGLRPCGARLCYEDGVFA